jgi:hypothetical protein
LPTVSSIDRLAEKGHWGKKLFSVECNYRVARNGGMLARVPKWESKEYWVAASWENIFRQTRYVPHSTATTKFSTNANHATELIHGGNKNKPIRSEDFKILERWRQVFPRFRRAGGHNSCRGRKVWVRYSISAIAAFFVWNPLHISTF